MATKEGIVLTIFYTWGRRKRRQNELGYSFLDSCLARLFEVNCDEYIVEK